MLAFRIINLKVKRRRLIAITLSPFVRDTKTILTFTSFYYLQLKPKDLPTRFQKHPNRHLPLNTYHIYIYNNIFCMYYTLYSLINKMIYSCTLLKCI